MVRLEVSAPSGHRRLQKTMNKREVRVRMNVKRVINIDLVAQCFKARFLVEASWVEPKMAHLDKEELEWDSENENTLTLQRAGKLKLRNTDKDKDTFYFAPRLSFRNLVELASDEEMWYVIYENTEDPEKKVGPIVCLRWAFTGVFQENFELQWFPLDTQELTFELLSDDDEVGLVHNQSGHYRSSCNASRDEFPLNSEYILSDRVRFKESETKPSASAQKHTYSLLRMEIFVKRRVAYWGFNVVVPLSIITGAAFASYFVPQGDLADRCSITTTMLLAQVAYKYLVAEKLPNLGYATAIDSYVLLCFVITFAILVAQCPAAVGLYTEPTFAVNITEGGETRVVLLPTLGLALFGSWCALHMLLWLVVAVLALRIYRAESFWFGHSANTAAWIGSTTNDVTEEQVTSFLEELRTKKGKSSATGTRTSMFALGQLAAKPHGWKPHERVLVWSEEAIKATMANSASGGTLSGALQDVNHKSDASNCIVAIMESAEDVEALVSAWHANCQAMASQDGSIAHPAWAAKRLEDGKGWSSGGKLRIEPLESGWAPLTTGRTYKRGHVLSG